MTPYVILLVVITLVKSEVVENGTACDGFQANFNLKDVIGDWYVVAIIPEKSFDDGQVTCYKTEISETDEASLRWLINKTEESPKSILVPDDGSKDSIVIRQGYHTENPFDVWSKSIHGVQGCFQEVMSLDSKKKHIHKAAKHNAVMQLHLLELEGREPFLLQMLWGRIVAVIIYRRDTGVVMDELGPVYDLMNILRGPQRLPQMCENPLRDLLEY